MKGKNVNNYLPIVSICMHKLELRTIKSLIYIDQMDNYFDLNVLLVKYTKDELHAINPDLIFI